MFPNCIYATKVGVGEPKTLRLWQALPRWLIFGAHYTCCNMFADWVLLVAVAIWDQSGRKVQVMETWASHGTSSANATNGRTFGRHTSNHLNPLSDAPPLLSPFQRFVRLPGTFPAFCSKCRRMSWEHKHRELPAFFSTSDQRFLSNDFTRYNAAFLPIFSNTCPLSHKY